MQAEHAMRVPKRTILYYPTITIPESWLRQALLYWDEIGSIVPHGYKKPPVASPDFELLKETGTFRPFRPEVLSGTGGRNVSNFESELANTVKCAEFREMLPPVGERKLFFRVHKDKVSKMVFGFLQKEGLAKETPDEHDWYHFEDTTARLYIAKLAKYLAAHDDQSTEVGTDSRGYERLNFHPGEPDNGIVCATATILNVLPVPRNDVPLKRILEFKGKDENYGQLLGFRQKLDDFRNKVNACKTREEAKDAVTSFSETLRREVFNLEASLRKGGIIATVLGFLEKLIRITSPAWLSTVVVAAGGATNIVAVPLAWTATGTGFAGAVTLSKAYLDKRIERENAIRESLVSYLLTMEQQGITDPTRLTITR